MFLQNITFAPSNKAATELYYKTSDTHFDGNNLKLHANCKIDLKTYFNMFSAEKWNLYTDVHRVFVGLELQGTLKVSVYHLTEESNRTKKVLLAEEVLSSDELQVLTTDDFELPTKGLIGLELTANTDTEISKSYFGTNQELSTREVFMGIGICTFKREPYVERNMKQLREGILENPESRAYGHVSVCISDNAGTLDIGKISSEGIKIFTNKNLGGVGGFTRTMFEHQKQEDATHILLMDDDAIISVEAIERTYTLLTLLKDKYLDYVIGGSLIRADFPTTQLECGAQWNKGLILSHGHNLDLSTIENVLKNEKMTPIEYTGWWYACIPCSFIENEKYPLPMFIHMDDVEYGLRSKGKFIFMNGICAWHEAFDNKHSGFLQYYDVRNLAITNAIHHPDYSVKDFKKTFLYIAIRNIVTYRYRYLDLNIRGVVDFMRGCQWLHDLDTLKLHQSLSQYGYQMELTDLLEKESPYGKVQDRRLGKMTKAFRAITLNGHLLPVKKGTRRVLKPEANMFETYRCEDVYYIDNTGKTLHVRKNQKEFWESLKKLWKVMRAIDQYYERAKKDYQENYTDLILEDFWEQYLEIK